MATTTPSDRATLAAGRALLGIGLGHLALCLPPAVRHGQAGAWLRGELRRDPRRGAAPSELAFWRGPGSLGVPLAVLGGVIAAMGRAGVPVPRAGVAALAAWAGFGAAVLEPSGFPLAAVPVGLLVAADRRRG